MGLFSRFNKSQVFSNVNTNDYTYINPKDLYEELKDAPIKVAGVFINFINIIHYLTSNYNKFS